MKHHYQRLMFLLMAMALAFVHSSAQIVLHEATDITQTKATLSADFPNISAEHGFHYKYGALPTIDEFSKVALSQHSDPVQLNTNNWKARSVKGYVENTSGESGSITAKVTLYKASTISFDWSIDAQEGCAYLRFCRDAGVGSSSGIVYVEVARITGEHPFSRYSVQLSEGVHYLKWEYGQISPSSVGLDIAQIKNITIENSLPGEWENVSTNTSEVIIDNLIPQSEVLYRAFDEEAGGLSRIGSFKTETMEISSCQVSALTQTTATITRNIGPSEASLQKGANYVYISPLLANLSSENTDCSGIGISAGNGWTARNGRAEYTVTTESGFSYGTLILTITIGGAKYATSKIEFDVSNEGSYHSGCYFGLFLDDNKNVNQTFKKGTGHYSVDLTSGVHTLTFKAQRWNNKAAGGTVSISGLCGENILGAETFNTLYSTTDDVKIENLKPDNLYMAQSFIIPAGSDNEPQAWQGDISPWFRVKTLPILVKADTSSVTQSSFILRGSIDKGDATTSSIGFQYRTLNGRWITTSTNNDVPDFSEKINRLKPGCKYECRVYAIPIDCDSVFSPIIRLSTKDVLAEKPVIVKVSQHEATLEGEVICGDAVIYQRGMQFRKKGTSEWEEVEDGGDGESYTLVKKNLEMGATYEARTYVQPAGCDVIYSDVLEFATLYSYFTKCNSNERTQTSVTFMAVLSDLDEGITVDRYGFEYYIDSDGFFENAESFVKSDVYDVTVVPVENEIKETVNGLCPSLGIRWRAYVEIDGVKNYYTGSKGLTWNYAGTERATIKATLKSLTQTTISLMLDASQDGDAVITGIEYALANSLEETGPYRPCGANLTINGLAPDEKYNLRFRGTVNGRLCPLLKGLEWDYSWFEYQTLPVAVDVVFSEITQTKAKMKLVLDAGDANVTNLRYRIGYGEIMPCTLESVLTGLCPGQSYRVTIFANVNGEELSWTADASGNAFEFKAKSVSVGSTCRDISQTSAVLGISTNVGDASFVSSGIECADKSIQMGEDGNYRINELTPNTKYYYRAFVETEEGGKVYSSQNSFTTKAISCVTDKVENISNRSATMNGEIECDTYSSAEFGFQWKQMVGWQSAPAFTKGVKRDDGTISVALVNGMLEPNTDYQYRTAVRYHDEFYTSNDWQTFRTESEFVYYPATVYTVFRTDRENNALILCGYYVAGSETIVSQGYEYWRLGYNSVRMEVPAQVLTVTTDESMQHVFMNGELQNGNYAVRAFVKTESGEILYGATLGFSVSENGYSGMDNLDVDDVEMFVAGDVLRIVKGRGLSCFVYTLNGTLVAEKLNMGDYEEIRLNRNSVYIAKLSNGKVLKVRM